MTRNKRFLGLLTGFFVLGCGSPVPPFTLPDAFIGSADGGVDANAAPVDGGRDAAMRDTGPSACASPRAVTLTAGMQTIMGNTTGMTMPIFIAPLAVYATTTD